MSGEFEDLHVCGYELRHEDPQLRATLADFRADRGRRIWAMADRLEELGFELDRRQLRSREATGAPLGRPHLADTVLAHPGNAARLRAGSPAVVGSLEAGRCLLDLRTVAPEDDDPLLTAVRACM